MNRDIEILEKKTLSNDWYTLQKFTLRQRGKAGSWSVLSREVYDRGNGAVVLLYNPETQTVVLTKQFRLPTFVNGNEDGMLIEACAGLLDGENPEAAIKRETEEETGFRISELKKILEVYMSPGSVTELLHFYLGKYTDSMKTSAGGGTGDEEQIEVLELKFNEAYEMISSGKIKDAKTIMLLQYALINNLFGKSALN